MLGVGDGTIGVVVEVGMVWGYQCGWFVAGSEAGVPVGAGRVRGDERGDTWGIM